MDRGLTFRSCEDHHNETTELPGGKSQLDKFKEATREALADEDEARWDERLKKVVKVKPKPEQAE